MALCTSCGGVLITTRDRSLLVIVVTYLTAYLDASGCNRGEPLARPELDRFLLFIWRRQRHVLMPDRHDTIIVTTKRLADKRPIGQSDIRSFATIERRTNFWVLPDSVLGISSIVFNISGQ